MVRGYESMVGFTSLTLFGGCKVIEEFPARYVR
jgi:hypothetical protein